MEDFTIVAVDNKEKFIERIKEEQAKGYKVKFTNMSISCNAVGGVISMASKPVTGFYAYMVKE